MWMSGDLPKRYQLEVIIGLNLLLMIVMDIVELLPCSIEEKF